MTASATPGPDPVAGALDLLGDALEGARSNERPDLLRRLDAARSTLAGTPHPAAVRDAAAVAQHALDSLEVDLRSRRAALADPDRANRVWAELGRTRQVQEEFRGRLGTWAQLLTEGFASVHSDVEFRLLTGMRAAAAESDQVVVDTDGRGGAEQLDAWVAQRVASEAAGIRALLHAGARRVAARLAEHLQLPADPVVPPVPELVLPDLRPSARPSLAPAPRRGAARLLTVGMPTYGGLMMGFILPRVLELALPQPLLLGLAALAAGAMGASAVAVERHQRREMRRNATRMTVRGAIDDASVALSKHVRDALRGIQQQVRDSTSAAAAERARGLDQRYRTVAAAAEAARDAGAAIRDIDADLAEIGRLRARARALVLPPARPAAGRPAVPPPVRLLAVVPERPAS